MNKFVFEADPPNTTRIPGSDILGVTVILLTCSYDDREFVRVGYYVNNEYTEPQLNEEPPSKPIIEKIRRNILAEQLAALKGTRPHYRAQEEIEEMHRFAEAIIYPKRAEGVMRDEAPIAAAGHAAE